MQAINVEVRRLTHASPATIYAIAKNSAGYPLWSRIGSFEHVRDGRGERFGVGSIRIYTTWPLKLHEEVVELVSDRLVAYVLHRGLPFNDYRATIEIFPSAPSGSIVSWRSAFSARIPGTAALCRRFVQSILNDMVAALAREAERVEKTASRSAVAPP
jgi:hypothetical protein